MTFLFKFLWAVALAVITHLSQAAPCETGLPDRVVPQAGQRGVAMFPQETIQREYQPAQKMANNNFDHVVGMINAVTIYPCSRGREATIEIHELSIVRFDEKGTIAATVATARYDGGRGTLLIDGGQWKRYPEWFISGQPLIQPKVSRQTGGTLLIDLAAVSDHIVHMWTMPRIKVEPGVRYGITAIVRVTGDARLQLGMDYWKGASSPYNGWSEGCKTSNNCEAWLSDWIGDTGGEFRLVVAPRSFGR